MRRDSAATEGSAGGREQGGEEEERVLGAVRGKSAEGPPESK